MKRAITLGAVAAVTIAVSAGVATGTAQAAPAPATATPSTLAAHGAAALVFGSVFFPSFSALAGTLAALGTYAVGFVARPLGAILFGHFGDRLGRKRMLIASLVLWLRMDLQDTA